ncbi:MAG: nitrous oxide reductase accessory protein NosL [Rhodobacterales bacterium]|nr:nitrous oxide reductase accessory protein NosL [Rhodobacterales bacterium]
MTCRCRHGHGPSRRAVLGLIAAAAVAPLAACDDGPQTGPGAIHWDRDVCELCRMMISDPHFVAQVRGGPKRKLYVFDDIGCAINWLNDQPWAGDAETEIWVADHASTRDKVAWLDAREAWFTPGPASPMAYNYAAGTEKTDTALRFEDLTGRILSNAPNHICPVPGSQDRRQERAS